MRVEQEDDEMRIILDGMGGDNAPLEIVKGAVEASSKIDHQIVIVGREDEINAELAKYNYDESKIQVVHASEVIENEDSPVKAIRRKTDSSMVKGLTMLKDGEGDLFISAGFLLRVFPRDRLVCKNMDCSFQIHLSQTQVR